MEFDAVANRLLGEPGVSEDQLVVKLPAPRVQELIASGKGAAFAPMADRTMKEWVLVGDGDELAVEALAFVSGR